MGEPSEREVLHAWQTGRAPEPGQVWRDECGVCWEVVGTSLLVPDDVVAVTGRILRSGFQHTFRLTYWLGEVDGRPRFVRVRGGEAGT